MRIQPVTEATAVGEVKFAYQKLKQTLNTTSVPLFFLYVGAFPNYLTHIADQLSVNLASPQFQHMMVDFGSDMKSLIPEVIAPSQATNDWLRMYSQDPAYFHFKRDLTQIFTTNIKLTAVFISLREALKSWSIAKHQLPKTSVTQTEDKPVSEYDFIFEDVKLGTAMVAPDRNTPAAGSAIMKNRLPEYLKLCQSDFTLALKTNEFWSMRIQLERLFLTSLNLFPNLVFSPINLVYQLTSTYPNFPDLIYLLSEHFPTYAMHRMIFSGYMLALRP